VGSRADTGVAFSLQASLRTLRTAGGHPRGFLSSLLRAYLPQFSQTCVLKRTLNPGFQALRVTNFREGEVPRISHKRRSQNPYYQALR
jgi:hypothetical protein